MDVAKSGGRQVHGGSLDPDVSTVMCPELSGQPAPKLSGFLWDNQLGNGVGRVGRSPLCLVQSSGRAHRSPSGTSLVPAQQPLALPIATLSPPHSSSSADFSIELFAFGEDSSLIHSTYWYIQNDMTTTTGRGYSLYRLAGEKQVTNFTENFSYNY